MSEYLKYQVYYKDLYDLWTIEECLRTIEDHNRSSEENLRNDTDNKLSKEEKVLGFKTILDLHLYYIKGNRYREKESIIEKWVNRDKDYDNKVDSARCPEKVPCLICYKNMKVVSKELYLGVEPGRVLFIFECLGCKKRRGVFDNGEEFKVNLKYCSKCNKEVAVENIRKGNIVTWVYKCFYCGLTETDIMDFDKENVDLKEKKRLESELLVKYRDEFCLSEKEGQEYVRFAREWVAIKNELESNKLKQSDPDYQKAITLKKLTIVELEKFLNGILNKEKYIKLEFDKPVIDKYVIIPLTVMDEDSSRKEYDSIHKLQRVLKKNLEGTNWRLMSEGIIYRLGCLSCKLKGYENEDDLIKIVKMKKF